MKNDTSKFLFCFALITILIGISCTLISINNTLKEQNEIQKEFTTEILNQIKK